MEAEAVHRHYPEMWLVEPSVAWQHELPAAISRSADWEKGAYCGVETRLSGCEEEVFMCDATKMSSFAH